MFFQIFQRMRFFLSYNLFHARILWWYKSAYGIECACESADCIPLSHVRCKFEEVKDRNITIPIPDAQFAVSTLPFYKNKI